MCRSGQALWHFQIQPADVSIGHYPQVSDLLTPRCHPVATCPDGSGTKSYTSSPALGKPQRATLWSLTDWTLSAGCTQLSPCWELEGPGMRSALEAYPFRLVIEHSTTMLRVALCLAIWATAGAARVWVMGLWIDASPT
eukprot:s3536_g4.t1